MTSCAFPAATYSRRVVRRLAPALMLGFFVLASTAHAQPNHGKLVVNRAGKGEIDLSSGSASFKLFDLVLIPSDQSDGINPAKETVTIGIAEERFLIPAGKLKASRNGKNFHYVAETDRGVQLFDLRKRSDQSFRVNLKLAGVDLSSLVITTPPICLPFAVIIGNDDGFSGVSFDLPNPYPSRRLSIPGFCTDETSWPWTS